MSKRESIFEMMADKSKKPDALGFQPFDPKIVEAVMHAMRGKK
jgi:hypothetical protein